VDVRELAVRVRKEEDEEVVQPGRVRRALAEDDARASPAGRAERVRVRLLVRGQERANKGATLSERNGAALSARKRSGAEPAAVVVVVRATRSGRVKVRAGEGRSASIILLRSKSNGAAIVSAYMRTEVDRGQNM
jgi:hypothetical protein